MTAFRQGGPRGKTECRRLEEILVLQDQMTLLLCMAIADSENCPNENYEPCILTTAWGHQHVMYIEQFCTKVCTFLHAKQCLPYIGILNSNKDRYRPTEMKTETATLGWPRVVGVIFALVM